MSLSEIDQIQRFFMQKQGVTELRDLVVESGTYVVPINDEDYDVEIKNNYINLKGKHNNVELEPAV